MLQLKFCYQSPETKEDNDDFLLIESAAGKTVLHEIVEVTPFDTGPQCVGAFFKLKAAIQEGKDFRGGVHIQNGGLDLDYFHEAKILQVGTTRIGCETHVRHRVEDTESLSDQIQMALEQMIPLILGQAEAIREKNRRLEADDRQAEFDHRQRIYIEEGNGEGDRVSKKRKASS